MSLTANIEFLRNLPKLPGFETPDGIGQDPGADGGSPIQEIAEFGTNPGDLRMFGYVPATAQARPALVVVLHGCTQTAAGYDLGAGWSTLADRYGFALLFPEQKSSNNPNCCFNWFNSDDIARDSGEALSIRQMIEQMVVTHKVDRARIFVTGLSAGGAMTSVMLATYPEVFAAGAIIAGLPYGVATSMQEALGSMFRAPARDAQELGNLVRQATAYHGPWPKVSVWHGSADRTVNPANAGEIVKQWLDLHQLMGPPMAAGEVDGYPHEMWWNAAGETVVESYTITGMAHGAPLAVAEQDEPYGVAGKFLLEAGIPSSLHIAAFFDLTSQPAAADKTLAMPARRVAAAVAPEPSPPDDRRAPEAPSARGALDIGGMISRVLTAAGLIK